MSKLVHLIVADKDDMFTDSVWYHSSEPTITVGAEYVGGFHEDISRALVFGDFEQAKAKSDRLAEIYSDVPCKMRVITMSDKELFKAKLGAQNV